MLFSLLLFSVAVLLRISLALQPGLWADEIFSLAMATGHSLEHPAAEANPTLGDFVEPRQAQPSEVFHRYMQHETPPAGPRHVIRAVLLSDTSPPLYYLILNLWTRAVGTNDAALRLFSTLWAMACFPLLWFLGCQVGEKTTAWIACLLFAFSPPALYYSAEGRMYSLAWFLALSLACSTLALAQRGPRPHLLILWSLSAAAGLLTHYFFAFVLAACFAWLLLNPGKIQRTQLAMVAAMVGLLVLPWYCQLPESLSRWRVTAGWLDYPLTWKQAVSAPFLLAYSFLSGYGVWGGFKWMAVCAAGLYALLILATVRGGVRRLVLERRLLLWFWLTSVCIGPLVFDLLQSTQTSFFARYVLPGLPAGLLLAAMAISWLPRRAIAAFLLLIFLAWLPGIRDTFTGPSRDWEPFPEVGIHLTAWAKPCDLIIVHSIPSGVLGVARYLDTSTPIASWVVQLKQRRVPDDIKALTVGCRRVALVKIHDMGELSPVEAWLRENARLDREVKLYHFTKILYFLLPSPPATYPRIAMQCGVD